MTPVSSGGFGKIRVGRDKELDRKVAVKRLDPVWTEANAEDKERFRREAKILAKFSHPNIPAIYDVIFEDTTLEIIFQFVEGRNMREFLEEETTLPLSDCLLWFGQIASALDHAHTNDVIHRDIKPEYIIVSEDRKHCSLVDFGIALSNDAMNRLTPSDEFIGTPGYMSREHERGEDVDQSDDIYVG